MFARAYSIHNVALGMVYLSGVHEKILELKEMCDYYLELYEKGLITTTVNIIKLENVKEALISI